MAAAIGHARFATRRIWCAAILGWVCATPIHAGESDFGVGLFLAHDSNIGRVETNPRSDWTEVLMFGFAYQENTADVTARVLAQVERRRFIRNTFSNGTGGYLSGAMVWTISPQRFTWTIADVFSEAQIDLTSPTTPSNLTKTNSLATGPDFTYPLSSTNSVVIGGRYGRFDIKDSTSDSQRYTVYVRGLHAFSAQTKLSLNYQEGRVYFDPGAQVPNVSREDWFARFENLSSANGTTIDLGTSRVMQYGGSALEPSRLARLMLWEKPSSQSTFYLKLSDQVSDTYSDRVAGPAGAGLGSSTAPTESSAVVFNGTDIASSDLYHGKRGELVYVNDGGRFRYTLQAYGRQVDFVTLDQDYEEKGGTFLWAWLSGAMQFYTSAAYLKRTFSTVDPTSPLMGRQDTDHNYSVGVTYRLNSNVTVTVRGDRVGQQSTAPLNSFVDNRVMLLLGYSTGPLYQVQSRR